jgi:hypothetical protein
VFDILIDFTLIALPTLIVWNLNMRWQRKLVVVSAFTFRLVYVSVHRSALSLD